MASTGWNAGIRAAGAILAYLQANLLGSCSHLQKLLPYRRSDYMVLDEATVRNLEIFQSTSFQGRKGSLLAIVDQTRTAMGGRKLQQWLRYPLLDLAGILSRQQAVAELVERAGFRAKSEAPRKGERHRATQRAEQCRCIHPSRFGRPEEISPGPAAT